LTGYWSLTVGVGVRAVMGVTDIERTGDWARLGVAERVAVRLAAGRRVAEAVIVGVRGRTEVAVNRR
jgi:hypothetical protein